jgi:hypothetical protein
VHTQQANPKIPQAKIDKWASNDQSNKTASNHHILTTRMTRNDSEGYNAGMMATRYVYDVNGLHWQRAALMANDVSVPEINPRFSDNTYTSREKDKCDDNT